MGQTLGLMGMDTERWQSRLLAIDDPGALTAAECAIGGALLAGYSGRGNTEVEEGVRAIAADWLQRGLATYPDDLQLWLKLAGVREAGASWEAAAEAYRKAAELDPAQAEYPARAALAYARLHRCTTARKLARAAVEPWQGQGAAEVFLATMDMNCGQLETARDALLPLAAQPEVPGVRKVDISLLLATCQERLGEEDAAQATLEKRIGEAPDSQRTYAYLDVVAFCRRQRRPAAGYAVARALFVGTDNEWSRQRAAMETPYLFGAQGIPLAAAITADIEAHPGDVEGVRFAIALYLDVSTWFRGFRDRDAVIAAAREAVEGVNQVALWTELAEAAEDSGDRWLAKESLRRAVGLAPEDAPLRLRYARAAGAEGDLTVARALADEACAKAAESPQAWRDIADLYLAGREWQAALAVAQGALDLTPEGDQPARMRAQVLAARAYVGAGDDQAAIALLTPIVETARDEALLRDAVAVLTDIYLASHDAHRAAALLDSLRSRAEYDGELSNWIRNRRWDVRKQQ
jgi:tetratricopeptide (TPR) repeat protein